MPPKNRNFVFTLNNYDQDSIDWFERKVEEGVFKYVGYSEEVAPTTGTKHLQGFASFTNARTVQQARSILVGCHVEVMLGSIAQNETYCSKSGELIHLGNL